jgi:predicted DNA-binding transcriptional regulator AlpA
MPPPTGFKFIDLPDAAQKLGITRLQMLDWVEQGKIKPFMGKGQSSVFRSSDVEKLASALAIEAAPEEGASTIPPAGEESTPDATPDAAPTTTRRKRRDPIKLIGTRLSMDSRWAEISDEDIATWLDAIEAVQFDRVRRVAHIAIERLNRVLSAIDADPRS